MRTLLWRRVYSQALVFEYEDGKVIMGKKKGGSRKPYKGGGGGSKISASESKKLAFWDSIRNEQLKTLRWSLDHIGGLEASTRDSSEHTSIMLAAAMRKPKALKMLLDFYVRKPELCRGGWVDCVDRQGRTALMMACGNGSLLCAQYIVEAAGRNATKLLAITDRNCNDARSYAEKRGNKEIVEWLDHLWDEVADVIDPEAARIAAEAEAAGLTTTQYNKEKKKEKELIEKYGSMAAAKDALAEEEAQRKAEEIATAEADAMASKAKASRPTAFWPEVLKVEKSVEMLKPLCEICVRRSEAVDGDCTAEQPFDEALWWLGETINRLEIQMPEDVLVSLPGGIGKLDKLQVLILNHNSLTTLPEALSSLTALRVLEVESNALETLPEAMGDLEKLETLNLANNKLTSDCLDTLAPLTCLSTLKLDNNLLTSIKHIPFKGLAKRLNILTAAGNQIKKVPSKIGKLVQLNTLSLQDNLITELPVEISSLKKIKTLNFDNNPIADNKVVKYLQKGGKGLKELGKYLEKMEKKNKGKKGGKKDKKKKKDKKAKSDDGEESILASAAAQMKVSDDE